MHKPPRVDHVRKVNLDRFNASATFQCEAMTAADDGAIGEVAPTETAAKGGDDPPVLQRLNTVDKSKVWVMPSGVQRRGT